MNLATQSYMPPPWLAYPEYERYSLGWRMGSGEDYLDRFAAWFEALGEKGREIYTARSSRSPSPGPAGGTMRTGQCTLSGGTFVSRLEIRMARLSIRGRCSENRSSPEKSKSTASFGDISPQRTEA